MNIDKRTQPIITITLDEEEAKILSSVLEFLRDKSSTLSDISDGMIRKIIIDIKELVQDDSP